MSCTLVGYTCCWIQRCLLYVVTCFTNKMETMGQWYGLQVLYWTCKQVCLRRVIFPDSRVFCSVCSNPECRRTVWGRLESLTYFMVDDMWCIEFRLRGIEDIELLWILMGSHWLLKDVDCVLSSSDLWEALNHRFIAEIGRRYILM